MEKYNGTQKYIPQLVVEENGLKKNLNNQPEIESASMKFYSKLFSNHDQIITQDIEQFLGPSAETLPKLSNHQSESINGYITVEDMTKYLNKN